MLSCFSCVRLCVTLWTVAHQTLLSMGFSRQEFWSVLPCPPPGDIPPGIESMFLKSPALAGGFLTTSTTWEAPGVLQSLGEYEPLKCRCSPLQGLNGIFSIWQNYNLLQLYSTFTVNGAIIQHSFDWQQPTRSSQEQRACIYFKLWR